MSKTITEERLGQLEAVQRVWAERGRWDLETERLLAVELGVDRRTVRAYRADLEKLIRRGLGPESIAARREEVVASAWATYRKASATGQLGVGMKALDLLSRVQGLAISPTDGEEGAVTVELHVVPRDPPTEPSDDDP